MYIKLFGERCSGTTYLSLLLRKNVNEQIYFDYYYDKSGWKHGFPRIEKFEDLDDTLFIFLIRDLEPWLLSMYNNPHHYFCPKNMEEFINSPLKGKDCRPDHDTNLYPEEKKNVVELRYAKIKAYLEFSKKVNNFVFVNLEDLQKDYQKFLCFLRDKFGVVLNSTLSDIVAHTKKLSARKTKNRVYHQKLPQIKSDVEIEEFVESLKKEYYYQHDAKRRSL